jgi:HPt (histidine-containing phosphotransfer) domain-containing protein
MTAAAMEGDREMCLEAGMDDYVTKPVRLDAIEAVLERWIVESPEVAHDSSPRDPADEGGGDDTGTPVLDAARVATLEELDGGDGQLLALLVEEYDRDARVQLDRIRAALAEGDPHGVERAAHTLKGASANIGAARLADACRELEGLGRAAALGTAPEVLARMDEEFDLVRHALGVVVAGS